MSSMAEVMMLFSVSIWITATLTIGLFRMCSRHRAETTLTSPSSWPWCTQFIATTRCLLWWEGDPRPRLTVSVYKPFFCVNSVDFQNRSQIYRTNYRIISHFLSCVIYAACDRPPTGNIPCMVLDYEVFFTELSFFANIWL